MQAVITKAQARAITRGREPHVPVEYEQAVTALQACLTLDETKYWSDRADALAAWAKIYGNDQAGRKAKMLKLHAYRRMGILAAELCPPGSRKMGVGNGKGSLPGPRALLESHGLSTAAADAARTLANHEVQRALMSLRSVTRRHTPAQVVATLSLIEKQNGRTLAGEISEWLDEFDARAGRT